MAHTVNLLSRFYTRPTYVACQVALHILVYLDNTVEHRIVFPNLTDEEPLRTYSDADWAGDLDTSLLTTGYIEHSQSQEVNAYPKSGIIGFVGIIRLNHVPMAEMIADMMTKALPKELQHQLVNTGDSMLVGRHAE